MDVQPAQPRAICVLIQPWLQVTLIAQCLPELHLGAPIARAFAFAVSAGFWNRPDATHEHFHQRRLSELLSSSLRRGLGSLHLEPERLDAMASEDVGGAW